MWRLIRNVTVGGVEGEVAPTIKNASNATKIVANYSQEFWGLVRVGRPNETAELDVGGYNSSDHNDSNYNLVYGSSGSDFGM